MEFSVIVKAALEPLCSLGYLQLMAVTGHSVICPSVHLSVCPHHPSTHTPQPSAMIVSMHTLLGSFCIFIFENEPAYLFLDRAYIPGAQGNC